MLQCLACLNQIGRSHLQRFGAGKEVGLIGFEKIQQGCENRGLHRAFAQVVGQQAGHSQHTVRAGLFSQGPCERAQGQCNRVRNKLFTLMHDAVSGAWSFVMFDPEPCR
jgi:hypothetical protein